MIFFEEAKKAVKRWEWERSSYAYISDQDKTRLFQIVAESICSTVLQFEAEKTRAVEQFKEEIHQSWVSEPVTNPTEEMNHV